MKKIKSYIGHLTRLIFSRKIYKLLANGAIIVPSYYKGIIAEAERNFDMSLEDTDDRALLLMRKYAHIIDKGLHRKDISPGHSKDYYLLLKDCVERLSQSVYKNDATLDWAKSKLDQYRRLQEEPDFKPLEGEKPLLSMSYDDFNELVKARRSNRDFSNKNISSEDIGKLKEIANWASSSCNKQPIEIYTTNDPVLAAECLRCCKGGTGFSGHIPSFWVFTANIRGYVWPSEIFLPVVDTCLGVQNVMLGATTLGMSATILSWAQKSEEEECELRKLLDIPKHHQIIICAVMGYAKSTFQTPARK